MRHWRAGPIWLWLVVAGMPILWLAIRAGIRYQQVEKAISRFEANPSPSTAQNLAQLLARRVPTHGQGKRILGLVLRPAVTTRSAYPVGKIPMISLAWPFRLDFSQGHDTYATLGSSVRLEGQTAPVSHMMKVDVIESAPRVAPWVLPCEVHPLLGGTYKGRIHIDCTVARFVPDAPLWMKLRSLLRGQRLTGGTLREAGSYQAGLEIPLEITVTESAAEQVALVSNPGLDKAVRKSFTRRPANFPYGSRGVGGSELLVLEYTNMPIAVAFEPVLRLSDGSEVRQAPLRERFRARANHGGWLKVHRAAFNVPLMPREEGSHEATIVLKPDPNFAYEDPAIKAIWNGTLEFPIRFTVSPGPDAK